MSLGRVVADGPPTEIKARVGRRIIRATLADADPRALAGLPGVATVDRHGDSVELQCTDSDAAVRALLTAYPGPVTSRSVAPASRRPSWSSRQRRSRCPSWRSHDDHVRLHPLRAAARLSQPRFFIFSLAFPVVMFFLIAGPNRHEQLDGISFPVYYMTGMIGWGTMAAVIAGGARIAAERELGWHRQLRVTPLPVRTYFRRQGADRLPDGRGDHRAALPRRARRWVSACRRRTG